MTPSLQEEFFDVADAAVQARANIRAPTIEEPMTAIERVCKEAHRA